MSNEMKVADRKSSFARDLMFFILLFLFSSLQAQQLTPLSSEMNRRIESQITSADHRYYTLLKPYLQMDSIYPTYYKSEKKKSGWLKRKLFQESLVEIDSSHFYLYFDPVFDFSVGQDNSGRKTFTNTRGFIAGGRLGKTFAFGTSFYENQAIFPNWVHNGIPRNKVITGQGMGRLSGQTWDYAHSSGYISYSPLKALNIQLGQGKNFLGDGYRSLVLSDVAYNYPYSRITFLSKKIMYSWMLGVVQDISIKKGNDQYTHGKRIISSHTLAANLTRNLQFSIIKNTVYNNPDTNGNYRFHFKEFNPVMIPENTGNAHSIWGVNLRLIAWNNLWLYGQAVFDNLFGNETLRKGFQIGSKYFNALGLKGLYLQAEYNQIDPQTYTSGNKTLNWLHYGESLAHPSGNNMREGIFDLVYSWKRWQLTNFTRISSQLESNPGISPAGSVLFPTVTNSTQVIHNYAQLNWFLNPKTTSHFSLGYIIHKENVAGVETSYSMISFSFRTALFNNHLNR